MNQILLESMLIVLLIILNGVFAMCEIAVVAARKARLQNWVNSGDHRARQALDLASEPSRFLSTVQVGITAIGVLSGALGGATIAEKLEAYFKQIPLFANYASAIGVGIVVIVITYLSLILGELVPKRIALGRPESIARLVAGPMTVLSRFVHPFVSFLTWSTDLVLKIFGFGSQNEGPQVTEEEIKTLVQQGAEAGALDKNEQAMVERVLDFGDRRISQLMTARPEIVWLDLATPSNINRDKMKTAPHSHFPVAKGSLDAIVGVIHVQDLFARDLSQPDNLNFAEAIRPALFIPETTTADKVLETFQQTRARVALIVDEYGMVQGLVTLTDILETIVGNLSLPHIEATEYAIQRKDGSWLLDGLIPIEDLKEVLKLKTLEGEDSGNFQTLAGFLMTQMGRIPKAAEHIAWNGYRFEIIDMDRNRIDKVLVTPPMQSREEHGTN